MCYNGISENFKEAFGGKSGGFSILHPAPQSVNRELIAMPYKPAKPCARPGCPALTHQRFCPDHARDDAGDYERYRRDPATRKRYGHSWQKIRAAYLAAHPLCEVCEQDGKLTPAVLVHHRVPLADGGGHEARNLQALCERCHSAHHARDGSRWGTQ